MNAPTVPVVTLAMFSSSSKKIEIRSSSGMVDSDTEDRRSLTFSPASYIACVRALYDTTGA